MASQQEPAAPFADVRPAADPDDAGCAWRTEKFKDFEWRCRCLGIDKDPEVAKLIREMEVETVHLQEVARVQAGPDYKRPWWADGEYDEERAEECNDKGMELFAKKQFEVMPGRYCPPRLVTWYSTL
jgi:hypothetical protein